MAVAMITDKAAVNIRVRIGLLPVQTIIVIVPEH
jgi:hypothetical protein